MKLSRILILSLVVPLALTLPGCIGVQASEEESAETPSTEKTKNSSTKTDPGFRLQVETREQKKGWRGSVFKDLGRGLMSPISPHTKTNKTPAPLKTTTLKGSAAARSLAEFDLEIVVDESKSMLRKDCPGGISRWEWCGEELSELSKQLAPYVQNGFTLITFASDYEVLENATPEDVIQRFDKRPAATTTRMSMPLNNRFKRLAKKSNSKPVLMVLITDGVPSPKTEADLVIDSLIAASKQVNNKRDLTVAIFEIGQENQEGKQFIKEIDDDLVKRGARYDIVRSLPFVELERVGLVNALVTVMRDFAKAPETNAVPVAPAEPSSAKRRF